MKSLRAVLFVFAIIVTSSCYPGINGKVVDNATGKPIEGAVVVALWTKTHGFGLTYHTLSKVTETLTDKEGFFELTGIYDPFVDPPDMVIYKEGYIPWRNDAVFPSSNKAKDNEWKNHVTYKLDVFTDKYTAEQLDWFLFLPTHMANSDSVPKFEELKNKASRRAEAERYAKTYIKWLSEFRTIIKSLENGSYPAYPNFRDRLTDKNAEMDWLINEAKKENSEVSQAMKEYGIIVEHKPAGSLGDGSIFITKR